MNCSHPSPYSVLVERLRAAHEALLLLEPETRKAFGTFMFFGPRVEDVPKQPEGTAGPAVCPGCERNFWLDTRALAYDQPCFCGPCAMTMDCARRLAGARPRIGIGDEEPPARITNGAEMRRLL